MGSDENSRLSWYELRRPSVGQADGRTALRSLLDTKLTLHVPRPLVLLFGLPNEMGIGKLAPVGLAGDASNASG